MRNSEGQAADQSLRRALASARSRLLDPAIMHWVAPVLLVLALVAAWILQTRDAQSTTLAQLAELLGVIFRNALPLALLAVGASFVISTAGVDLSSAGVATAAGAGFAYLCQAGWWPIPSLTAIVLLGAGIGSLLALSLNRRRAPILIVSWATGVLLFLFARILAQYLGKIGYEATVGSIQLPHHSAPRLAGLALVSCYTALGAAVLLCSLAGLSRLARAVGANVESATCAGIPIRATRLATYAVAGGFSAAAGAAFAMLDGSASTSSLAGYELKGIAIAVLAGTSLSGGRLNSLAVLCAALLWETVEEIAIAHVPAIGANQRHASGFIFALMMLGVALFFGKRLSGDTITITISRQHSED